MCGARRTSGSDFTGWPTPKVFDSHNESYETAKARQDRQKVVMKAGGQRWSGTFGLPAIAQLASWSTPSARDWKDSPGMATTGTNPDGSMRSRLDQLPRQAQLASWATPRAEDAESAGMRHSRGVADTLTA